MDPDPQHCRILPGIHALGRRPVAFLLGDELHLLVFPVYADLLVPFRVGDQHDVLAGPGSCSPFTLNTKLTTA